MDLMNGKTGARVREPVWWAEAVPVAKTVRVVPRCCPTCGQVAPTRTQDLAVTYVDAQGRPYTV